MTDLMSMIKSAEAQAMKGEYIEKNTVLEPLSLDPLSEECSALGEAARRTASRFCDDTAIVRLAGAEVWKNVAVHPVTEQAIRLGANTVSLELGANLRDKYEGKKWSTVGRENAVKMFRESGYRVDSVYAYTRRH